MGCVTHAGFVSVSLILSIYMCVQYIAVHHETVQWIAQLAVTNYVMGNLWFASSTL